MTFQAPCSGELRHRISLQARAQTPNAEGGFDDAYTTVASVRAKIKVLFGGRLIDGVQDQERVTHNFIIRWRSDRGAWRWVLFDGRRFVVRSVSDPTETKRWMEILAEETEVA